MTGRYTPRQKRAIRITTFVLAVLSIFGICYIADNFVFTDDASTTAAADKNHVSLREGDVLERTVTERGITFRRQYSVDPGGKLTKSDNLPTPYIATDTFGDITEATVDMLCDTTFVLNAESGSDHAERDTNALKDACSAARTAYDTGNIETCENSLVDLGRLLAVRVSNQNVLDYSFTNGNINAACGDENGRSAAYASGTYDVPVLQVSMGK